MFLQWQSKKSKILMNSFSRKESAIGGFLKKVNFQTFFKLIAGAVKHDPVSVHPLTAVNHILIHS